MVGLFGSHSIRKDVFFFYFFLFWQFADGCLVGVGDGGGWWLVVVVVAMRWL